MGDEKTQDKPPAPVQQQPPKDQHSGPGSAMQGTEHKQATPAGQAAAMQQSVGNQQVNRIMRAAREPGKDPHAPGLKVSHPQDAAEKEAEAVAKKVTGDQPAHPHDHPGPAPGDPAKVAGDPSKVHGDPDVVHRAVADHDKKATATKPPPAAQHPAAPAGPQHPAPAGPSPTSILDHPGPGQPIPQPTRGTLEAKLKADLSHVVVHDDAASDKAVRALQARAVTRGNHIFLASDASPRDLSLMAHEVAHVLHHDNDTIHRQAGRTGPPTGPTAPPPTSYTSTKYGTINTATNHVDLEQVRVPDWRLRRIRLSGMSSTNLTLRKVNPVDPLTGTRPASRNTKQGKTWTDNISIEPDASSETSPTTGTGIGRALVPKLKATQKVTPTGAKKDRYILALLSGVLVGTWKDMFNQARLPQWNRSGGPNSLDIDHIIEDQVGGKDEFQNYWLLDSSANQTSGPALDREITAQINGLLTEARLKLRTGVPTDASAAREEPWRTTVKNLVSGLEDDPSIMGNPSEYWLSSEVISGKALEKAYPVKDANQAAALGFPGSEDSTQLIITVDKYGGGTVKVPWDDATHQPRAGTDLTKFKLFPYLRLTDVNYDTAKGTGEITGQVRFKGNWLTQRPTPTAAEEPVAEKFKLTQNPTMAKQKYFATIVNGSTGVDKKTRTLRFKGLSDVDVIDIEMREGTGFYLRGVLTPSIPLLRKQTVDLEVTGDQVTLEKTWRAGDLAIPGPIKLTQGAFTVSVGPRGLAGSGRIEVQLASIANGSINGTIDGAGDFALDGKLDFDKTLFQPASLGFFYRKVGADYEWGLGGHLGIGPKQIPGIKQADITASYQNGQFSARGDAQLEVPGLQSGSLAVTYSERDGISVGGAFGFAPSPVIESGSMAATVSKRPPGNRWALSASGTVKPKVPGVDTTLSASYEDGVFTVEGSVAYARGMLSGSLTVGMTNRPLDPHGHPAGAPHVGAPLRPYGGGTLTARITPWLQGTVGVQLQADGSVQLMGEIALPDSVNLFNAMQVQKNLLNIGMDIPIVGVAVMGQRIGIFATIQGGLDASASLGPGQLRQLSLRVQYNPEHEDRTQITGGAQLYIPAQAGLRLYVRGALGAGIPVVSAEAGLEIGGKLGVEGAVQAGVTVNWTPKQGLVIDAQASLSAEPSFTFDINGYVKVGADLVVTSVTLYEKHWQLASFRYGSGLHVGVRAPIHYEQGKPFTFSLSDVQFDLPKIDPKKVLTDLVHQIA